MKGEAAALDEMAREDFLEEVTFGLSSDQQEKTGLGRAGESELQAERPAKAKALTGE